MVWRVNDIECLVCGETARYTNNCDDQVKEFKERHQHDTP